MITVVCNALLQTHLNLYESAPRRSIANHCNLRQSDKTREETFLVKVNEPAKFCEQSTFLSLAYEKNSRLFAGTVQKIWRYKNSGTLRPIIPTWLVFLGTPRVVLSCYTKETVCTVKTMYIQCKTINCKICFRISHVKTEEQQTTAGFYTAIHWTFL